MGATIFVGAFKQLIKRIIWSVTLFQGTWNSLLFITRPVIVAVSLQFHRTNKFLLSFSFWQFISRVLGSQIFSRHLPSILNLTSGVLHSESSLLQQHFIRGRHVRRICCRWSILNFDAAFFRYLELVGWKCTFFLFRLNSFLGKF